MGAGAWGTALAKVLADAGNDVTLWARRTELADEINDTHRNSNYLGDVWFCQIHWYEDGLFNTREASAETAPEAICRAALKAWAKPPLHRW